MTDGVAYPARVAVSADDGRFLFDKFLPPAQRGELVNQGTVQTIVEVRLQGTSPPDVGACLPANCL